MRFSLKACAEPAKARSFYPNPVRRLPKAYHLQFKEPISWTYARDVQNSIVQAYQEYHVNPFRPGYALPPTFITLRFKPVFTYGRHRNERPSIGDRKLLEGLPDEDGYAMETRMAWNRQSGWRFHGPGQLWCWMVCDMLDWNMQLPDVEVLMKSALSSVIEHYLPGRLLQRQPIYNIPTFKIPGSESDLLDTLTSIELHENKYRIISYGCSLNLSDDQLIGQSRLSRYGFDTPEITTLTAQSWQNQEPTHHIHSRLVSQLSHRLNLTPTPISSSLLATKLHTTIPTADVAIDRHRRLDPRFADAENALNEMRFASMRRRGDGMPMRVRNLAAPMEFDSRTLRKIKREAKRRGQEIEEGDGEILFVPSWGQYVRKAMLKYRFSRQSGMIQTIQTEVEPPESELEDGDDKMAHAKMEYGAVDNGDASYVSAVREEIPGDIALDLADEVEFFEPPPKVLQDTIQWSTDIDLSFSPHVHPRRSVVSPREFKDQEYLDDPSRRNGGLDSQTQNKSVIDDEEQRRQIIQRMQIRGEDRI